MQINAANKKKKKLVGFKQKHPIFRCYEYDDGALFGLPQYICMRVLFIINIWIVGWPILHLNYGYRQAAAESDFD